MLKHIWRVGVCVVALALFIPAAVADIAIPTTTTVYFEMDSEPFESPVDYEVKCYGYNYGPDLGDVVPEDYDPENPELVYSYSASCPEYGCEIDEGYYLNYRHIDSCDLEGETADGTFLIENFADTPMPEGCEGDGLGRTCEVTFEIPELIEAVPEVDFSDVEASNEFYDAISYVKSEGIVEGYEDGTYKPDAEINRAELTKIIIEATFDDSVIENCTPSKTYSDMPVDAWYEKYVCVATNNDIVEGYEDGTFKGSNYINFAEAAKIIVLGFGFEIGPDEGVWYAPYAEVMEGKNAIPVSIDSFAKEITRGEMAELIYRLKQNVTDKPSATLL